MTDHTHYAVDELDAADAIAAAMRAAAHRGDDLPMEAAIVQHLNAHDFAICRDLDPAALPARGVLVVPDGMEANLDAGPDGPVVLPADIADRMTPEAIAALAAAGIRNPTRLPPPPAFPWADLGYVIARLIIVAALMLGAGAIGYTIGLRTDSPEHERTRRAVCQVLDHLGADASTAAQAEPCADTPAGS